MQHFSYSVNLQADAGGVVVTFPDIPEAITQGDDLEQALSAAQDCLEEAIANRIIMRLPIPYPSIAREDGHIVPLHATLAAKAALYLAMREADYTNIMLAEKLRCDEKVVRRLLDPHYPSKFPRVEAALAVLGFRLEVGVTAFI